MKSAQHVFDLDEYRCVSGKTLRNVKVGYETYGTLNPDRSNAILVCHYFSGNARAAGAADDVHELPGWWDKIIGPGKALDTDRYFVICSNSLANLNACDGYSVTTGPASENPETGRAWGLEFPLVTVEDFVHVQKRLLESLGIERLVAAAGPSGGSVQAIQWSVDYPDMVPRVIAVISPGLYIHPYAAAMMELWARPITADPVWNGGGYDAANPPREGLTNALAMVNLTSLSYDVVGEFGYEPAEEGKHPADSLDHQFIADATLDGIARVRAETLDANSFLYMVRAYKLYDVRQRLHESRARYLFIPSETDMVFPPHLSVTAVEELKAAGLDAELSMLEVSGGHLDGLAQIDRAAPVITSFLEI
ncbi:MAG: homoserine O-acetyltransferase [Woeseiaceae bacterium]|nr:homoserine O-acetyltransferase [Woeseiaceae bacterium]